MGKTNRAMVDASNNLISISGLAASQMPDSNWAAVAFLNSGGPEPFGARAADNTAHIYPAGDWADSTLYDLLNTAGFSDPGGTETDFSALLTFKKTVLIPGETLKVNFALLTSKTGRAPLLSAADSAQSLLNRLSSNLGCFLQGDLNNDSALSSTDIVFELNLIFLGNPPPEGVPVERGDMDCDGLLDAVDAVILLNRVFLNTPSVSCSCR
jgi:hypothetical protein